MIELEPMKKPLGAERFSVPSEAAENYKKCIQKGSKSFYFASLLLSPPVRLKAYWLYSWCRISDDLIDEANDLDEAKSHLIWLREATEAAFLVRLKKSGGPHGDFTLVAPPGLSTALGAKRSEELRLAWWGLVQLLEQVAIEKQVLLDLLRGYETDLKGVFFPSLEGLLDYCYCVAGTVGIMMAQVMGVRTTKGLEAAKGMGVAMQLTNIVRDFEVDLCKGRVYIPGEWIQGAKVWLSQDQHDLKNIAKDLNFRRDSGQKLVELAEGYYKKGFQGLRYLDWPERWAIATAGLVYRQIGFEALKQWEKNWSVRFHTSIWQKLWLAVKGLWLAWRAR